MESQIKNFLFEYFWLPIIDESVHYNPYNTIVYALLFGALAVYVLYPLIKKLEINFDEKFFIGMTPFILLGGAARSLKDIGVVETILFETPFIYIILFFYGLIALTSSNYIQEKMQYDYVYPLLIFGTIPLLVVVSFFEITNFDALQLAILTTLFTFSIVSAIVYFFTPHLFRYEFLAPVLAHYLDAVSTFVALRFGAEEKHVLGDMFIQWFGDGGLFILKTLVIVPISYYLVEEYEHDDKMFYIFLITMLGVGIATRNFVSTF